MSSLFFFLPSLLPNACLLAKNVVTRAFQMKSPGDGSEGGPDRLSFRRSAQRLIRFAVAADYTAQGPRIPGVFRLITAEILAFNI